jgi:hypothetical protein
LITGCPGVYTDWYPLPQFDKEFVDSYYDRFSMFRKSNVTYDPKKYEAVQKQAVYLFNIKEDPFERNNLATQYPNIVQQLEAKLDEYKKSVVEPLNPPYLLPDRNSAPSHWGDKWSPGWCS